MFWVIWAIIAGAFWFLPLICFVYTLVYMIGRRYLSFYIKKGFRFSESF